MSNSDDVQCTLVGAQQNVYVLYDYILQEWKKSLSLLQRIRKDV